MERNQRRETPDKQRPINVLDIIRVARRGKEEEPIRDPSGTVRYPVASYRGVISVREDVTGRYVGISPRPQLQPIAHLQGYPDREERQMLTTLFSFSPTRQKERQVTGGPRAAKSR